MKKWTAGLALVIILMGAGNAAASSGKITRAIASRDWRSGNISVSITWTGCKGSGECRWLPFVSAQPSSVPGYGCRGDEAFDSDPDTAVQALGMRYSNRTVRYSGTMSLVRGVTGQRLCLSVVQFVSVRDPICVAQAPILGDDPNDCPFITRRVGRVIATKLFHVRRRHHH